MRVGGFLGVSMVFIAACRTREDPISESPDIGRAVRRFWFLSQENWRNVARNSGDPAALDFKP